MPTFPLEQMVILEELLTIHVNFEVVMRGYPWNVRHQDILLPNLSHTKTPISVGMEKPWTLPISFHGKENICYYNMKIVKRESPVLKYMIMYYT
jgi:hypothetical protein